ncbi:hypothetical protein KM043_016031 [Ampulex compressa]|nr:hypothetical protein KM043_016031 [Ampulex compressa]
MQCEIDDLPDELLEYILSLVPPYKDLQECKLVSKRWCHITKNVIEHHKGHFHKSVAYGSLLWNPWPTDSRSSTIGKRHSHSACTYNNSMTWVRLITMGNYPSPKACATMLSYENSLILFGGWSHPSPYPLHQPWKIFNELHIYSIELNKWSAINTLETPPPTSAHSATIHGNFMVVFGGLRIGYRSNDVWCLNLITYCWHKQPTSVLKPQPRYGQSQIELGEKYLLILGGCTGPNVAMNDAWVLHMEGPIWTWKKINMYNTEYAQPRIWCHQACKVGDHIVVLSRNKWQAKPNDMSISLKKGTRTKSASQVHYSTPRSHERQGNGHDVDRDVNVNGRHGYFVRSYERNGLMYSVYHKTTEICNAICPDNILRLEAFRDQPSHSSSNGYRQRQLESLRRMELFLKSKREQSKIIRKTENSLSIFVLDIGKTLSDECSASWVPPKSTNHFGPDERILYSLVVGRGELILFGGIRKEQASVQGHPELDDSEVYNELYFITPPRYVI